MGPAIVPVLLAGGAGARLWPASDACMPKPFLPLADGRSTFAATLERVADPTLFAPPVVIASGALRYLIEATLAEAGIGATLLLEAEATGTAAAIAVAASWSTETDPDTILLCLATDHLIRDAAGFRTAVAAARIAAGRGRIVVFGIPPRGPDGGYGYIRPGAALAGADAAFDVAAFHEKPDQELARRLIGEGCLWNSGDLLATASTLAAEIGRHAPAVAAAAAAAIGGAVRSGHAVELARMRPGPGEEAASFDRAVLEKTGRAAVVAARFDWADIGTWASVWEASEHDPAGNAVEGAAVLVGTTDSLVRTDGPVVGVVGMTGAVVVAANNGVLVAPRECAGEVRSLASALAARGAQAACGSARHYRPWGYFQSLDVGPAHQVKRIVLNPGGRLSLQRHRHRSEHWTVVGGTAEVTIDADIRMLAENQSAFVPLGAAHRIANPGSVPATIIEVQYGDYLGEDDTVRIEDDYGRQQPQREASPASAAPAASAAAGTPAAGEAGG